MSSSRSVRLLVAVLVAVTLSACSAARDEQPVEDPDAVHVASFDFVESRLLAELYAAALEAADLPVVRRLALGPREIVLPALEQGHVDVVPEYAGSSLNFLSDGSVLADGSAGTPDAVRRGLDAALAERGLRALSFAPGQDQNGVVVSTTTARRHGLERISDLEAVSSQLTFGGPPECPSRPLCLLGLQERYGLQFAAFVPFDSRAATAEALLAGQLDVGMLETVDAYLADGRLALLLDDRHLQPPENVVPVVRLHALSRHGEPLARALDALSATLTTTALVDLHRQVVLERRPLADVAQQWLRDHDLA